MSRAWIYLRLVHIVADIAGVYGAFVFAYFVRVGWIFSTDFPFPLFAWLAGGAVLVWSGFLLLTKYYRIPPRSGGRVWFDVLLAGLGGVVAVGMLIVTYFFPRDILFSRLIGVYIFAFGFVWLLVTQFLFRSLLALLKKKEKAVYQTLIIGANRTAEKLIEAITRNPYAPYKIRGAIDPYGLTKTLKGSVILGKLDKLETVCEQEKITAIIQCDAFEHTLNIISFCDEKKIKFQFDPALRGVFEDNLRIREVAGRTMISFVQRNYEGTRKLQFRLVDWVLRQVFDID
ncbi:hypothetical protein K9L63_02690 [Candidatus Gracilibacteria bacterium]|nr:hypothetical protein [Candidatus Gracilibacteria bacterium]